MGFGSYDESEQEQEREQEDDGESVEKVGESKDGEDSVADKEVVDMLEHL